MRTVISILLLTILFIGCSQKKYQLVKENIKSRDTSMYVGEASITTLGTIGDSTFSVWRDKNGNPIMAQKMQVTQIVHDTIYIDTCNHSGDIIYYGDGTHKLGGKIIYDTSIFTTLPAWLDSNGKVK